MNDIDIDDILSAVSNANRETTFNNKLLESLQKRSPENKLLAQPSITQPSITQPLANQSTLLNNQFNKITDLESAKIGKINQPMDPVSSASDSNNSNSMVKQSIGTSLNQNNILLKDQKLSIKTIPHIRCATFYGYSIPMSTIYFVIVLLIIGILLYIFTGTSSNKKISNKKQSNEKQSNEKIKNDEK